MDDGGALSLRVGSEKNRGAENALERSDETTVLRTALLHSKGVQHARGTIERDSGAVLPDCHGRKKIGTSCPAPKANRSSDVPSPAG